MRFSRSKTKSPFLLFRIAFRKIIVIIVYTVIILWIKTPFLPIIWKGDEKEMDAEMLGSKNDKTYTRRISQVGNSLSVSIPKDLATMLNLNKGDEIEIYYDKERGEIVMKRANRIPKEVRPEVVMAMNRAISKYDEALRNLKYR